LVSFMECMDPIALSTTLVNNFSNQSLLLQLILDNANQEYVLGLTLTHDPDFAKYVAENYSYLVAESLRKLEGMSVQEYLRLVKNHYGDGVLADLLAALGGDLMFTQKFVLSEHHLYGSSRLGVKTHKRVLLQKEFSISGFTGGGEYIVDEVVDSFAYESSSSYFCRVLGQKQYEVSNHLGNVLATVLDRRTGVFDEGADTLLYYVADVVNATVYYPFGSSMVGYKNEEFAYSYGWGSHERVDEISRSGNHYTAMFWEYDSRTCRRWNVDPVYKHHLSNYSVMSGNPISRVDPNGANDDWVEDADRNIKWDKDANSPETTKEGEKYLGKTLTFTFKSYIDGKLWDGPLWKLPAGDKLTSTITLIGNENEAGELTGLTATKIADVGSTPVGKARNFYPGLGSDQNKFSFNGTQFQNGLLSSTTLNFEQHASVSPSEEFGMSTMGYNIVNVAQKLNINYSQGQLTVSSYTDIFPSATLAMNGSQMMYYPQPSFKATHSLPIIGWTTPNPYKDHSWPRPIYDYSYKPAMWYKR